MRSTLSLAQIHNTHDVNHECSRTVCHIHEPTNKIENTQKYSDAEYAVVQFHFVFVIYLLEVRREKFKSKN